MPNQSLQVSALSIQIQSNGTETPSKIKLLPIDREIVATDGRKFILDAPDEVMVSSMRPNVDMSIDYEHAIASTVKEAKPAAGWIKALSVEADGIYGEVEWTPKAKEMIANKEYRYLSPYLTGSRNNDGQFVIRKIVNVALTNNPALEMEAFCSAEHDNRLINTSALEEVAALLNIEASSPNELISCLKQQLDENEVVACKADVQSVISEYAFPVSCESELLTVRQSLGKEQFQALSQKLSGGGFGWAYLKGPTQTEALTNKGVHPLQLNNSNFGLTEGELEACRRTDVKPEDYAKIKENHNDY